MIISLTAQLTIFFNFILEFLLFWREVVANSRHKGSHIMVFKLNRDRKYV